MARAQPIAGLDANAIARQNLPQMFSVRIAELWGWAEHMQFPGRVRELHHMRIAAKRLRYMFEFFAPCFPASFNQQLKCFKQIQDYLGEIHDCDVWVDYLRQQLRDAFQELNTSRKALDRFTGADPDLGLAADALREDPAHGAILGLLMLITDVVERRGKLYSELLDYWRELEASDFHGQLVRAVAVAARGEGGAE